MLLTSALILDHTQMNNFFSFHTCELVGMLLFSVYCLSNFNTSFKPSMLGPVTFSLTVATKVNLLKQCSENSEWHIFHIGIFFFSEVCSSNFIFLFLMKHFNLYYSNVLKQFCLHYTSGHTRQ